MFLIFLWITITLSVALLGLLFVLLFPRGADATVEVGRRFWPAIGWGALIGIVGPILAVLVLVTIVGIPFGFGMLSALNVLAPLGYVASSLILGRLMVKGTSTVHASVRSSPASGYSTRSRCSRGSGSSRGSWSACTGWAG